MNKQQEGMKGRRTTNPMTRREAEEFLAELICDGRESRLAASYLDMLDMIAELEEVEVFGAVPGAEVFIETVEVFPPEAHYTPSPGARYFE